MSKEIKVEGMFYFVWDDMIVLKSYIYNDVLEEATKYFNVYGKDHTYNIYTVNKYNFKEIANLKEC